MTTTLPAMRDALISALHARLRDKLGLPEITGAVDAALDTVGYAGLVEGLAGADAAASAYKAAYEGTAPADLADLETRWISGKEIVQLNPINREVYEF